MRAWVAVVIGLFVASLLPTGSAQGDLSSCGEGFELFIRNPDIQTEGDGKIHVSGDFFVQFQVIGENADQIETFAFSVGLPVDNPEEICQLPVWPGGLMLEAYKSDEDGSDGFFILMNTKGQSTPQGIDLSVAVHGYDGAGNELARFWTTAVVESCTSTAPIGGCPESEAVGLDNIVPWPIILPGDGEASLVTGFTVEFPEALSTYRIELNGEDVTDQMEPFEGRLWDRDTFWDYGPRGIFGTVTPRCTLPAPIHECGPALGPSLEWTQRAMSADDVIRVVGTDLNGNTATKEIHIGSSVAGGTIADGLPILQMTFVESGVTAAPGEVAVFSMEMQNTGGGEGHPFARAEVPEGWDYEWVPGHRPVPAGGSSQQELHITVPELANEGEFPVRAIIDYRQGTQDKTLESALNVGVVLPEGVDAAPVEDDAESEDSPAFGVSVAAALLACALALRRRTT